MDDDGTRRLERGRQRVRRAETTETDGRQAVGCLHLIQITGTFSTPYRRGATFWLKWSCRVHFALARVLCVGMEVGLVPRLHLSGAACGVAGDARGTLPGGTVAALPTYLPTSVCRCSRTSMYVPT